MGGSSRARPLCGVPRVPLLTTPPTPVHTWHRPSSGRQQKRPTHHTDRPTTTRRLPTAETGPPQSRTSVLVLQQSTTPREPSTPTTRLTPLRGADGAVPPSKGGGDGGGTPPGKGDKDSGGGGDDPAKKSQEAFDRAKEAKEGLPDKRKFDNKAASSDHI